MFKLITKTEVYYIREVLSNNFPFIVLDAINESGKHVVVKKVHQEEDTLCSYKDTYEVLHSGDLKTSAWYGHKKAEFYQVNSEKLLIEQYKYLCKCFLDYNISNCNLQYDLNNKPLLVYDFINGHNLHESRIDKKSDFFLRMIPSLLSAVSNYPHGDLSLSNLIIHEDKARFSIIDPAILYNQIFFTNTEYYPLVPPMFYSNQKGYANYADQLAIGLMLYKMLVGINPLREYTAYPFWAKESGFGNPIGWITDDIYSVISIFPESWEVSFNFNKYIIIMKFK